MPSAKAVLLRWSTADGEIPDSCTSHPIRVPCSPVTRTSVVGARPDSELL
ncbi:MAG TPA: hypothetical protein VGM10_26455 [Actinocrinis sp.]